MRKKFVFLGLHQCIYSKAVFEQESSPCFAMSSFTTSLYARRESIFHVWSGGKLMQCTIVQNREKHKKSNHWIIQCPTSSGVSKVSEWVNKWAQWSMRAKQAGRSKRTNERCKPRSKQMSEWPSTAVWILGYSGPQFSQKSCCLLSQWSWTTQKW